MKLQRRDAGLLGVGFVIGFTLAILLAKHWSQPIASPAVPGKPSQRVHLPDGDGATGGSIASPELKQLAVRKILEIDLSKYGACAETRNIKPRPVGFMQPGVLTERWSVERCGSVALYTVQFIPTQHGEMEITISAEN